MRRLHGTGGAAFAAIAAVAITDGSRLVVATIVVAAFLAAGALLRPLGPHMAQLPLMRRLPVVLSPVLALSGLAAAQESLGAGVWSVVAMAIVFAAALAGSLLIDDRLHRAHAAVRRMALVGGDDAAAALRDELASTGVTGYEVVGRIVAAPPGDPGRVPVLGDLRHLGGLVVEHELDLIVLAPGAPRMMVFDEMASSCLELPVRLVDLDAFCERVLGHVPVRTINSAWFQYLMHPRFRRRGSAAKRVFDLAIACAVGIVALPLVALAALLIRRDGGPVFFMQTRIGEGGRPFRIVKLRTMRVSDGPTDWTTAHDPRVTPIGALLRRTHLDELPQLINVLRGEMSIVGPRPEQAGYVAALERDVPFYSRRHLIKPGITGWAQVRCGYAGSVEGSVWKMCHDLYYVKHRSVWLDALILGETLRTLFADRQFPDMPVETVLAPSVPTAERVLVSA